MCDHTYIHVAFSYYYPEYRHLIENCELLPNYKIYVRLDEKVKDEREHDGDRAKVCLYVR